MDYLKVRRRHIFDSHAHYDDARYDEDPSVESRDGLLNELFEEEVKMILNAGTNLETSRKSLALAEKYSGMYAAVGIHPHDAENVEDDLDALRSLRELLYHEKAVAIGEIGLDFHYDFSDRAMQLKWFELQMELASRTGYPVVIHDREAHGICMDIIRQFPRVRGVVHSYSGSAEMAKELVRLGYYISVSGVVTFKNAGKILEVVKTVPIERLLIETDCPYMAPHPFRGRINHSGYLKYIAKTVAKLREMEYLELCDITCANACALFGIEQ